MKNLKQFVLYLLLFCVGLIVGWFLPSLTHTSLLRSPFVNEEVVKRYPYTEYTFENLRNRKYLPNRIVIEKPLSQTSTFQSYLFSYAPLGRKMTGQLNVPQEVSANTPVIIMNRGYVPQEIFVTGVGTSNAAAALANAGFITLAPDFFGYGESDPEPTDTWIARFEKPIAVIELLETVRQVGVPITQNGQLHKTAQVGFWGHSNGGQITMSVLEILEEPIPTTLWAPVLAPFPYSVLFYSDEIDDEGRDMRFYVNNLERDYDLKQFSVTQHLDGLSGPILLHHGTADDAALIAWSDEFMDRVEKENDQRAEIITNLAEQEKSIDSTQAETASPSATFTKNLAPIDITYYRYPSTDHNMRPNWDTVVMRDIEFFKSQLL